MKSLRPHVDQPDRDHLEDVGLANAYDPVHLYPLSNVAATARTHGAKGTNKRGVMTEYLHQLAKDNRNV